MTRATLMAYKKALEEAAVGRGLQVRFAIAEGASESEIVGCESAIGVRLPPAYRATLAEWNGCEVEIFEIGDDPTKKLYRGTFTVADADSVSVWTRRTRDYLALEMDGLPMAEDVNAMMSRIAVVTYHDDFAAFITCNDGAAEPTVQLIDMEYAGSQLPPKTPTIASSTDEYFEKCFNRLAETLETEIFW